MQDVVVHIRRHSLYFIWFSITINGGPCICIYSIIPTYAYMPMSITTMKIVLLWVCPFVFCLCRNFLDEKPTPLTPTLLAWTTCPPYNTLCLKHTWRLRVKCYFSFIFWNFCDLKQTYIYIYLIKISKLSCVY